MTSNNQNGDNLSSAPTTMDGELHKAEEDLDAELDAWTVWKSKNGVQTIKSSFSRNRKFSILVDEYLANEDDDSDDDSDYEDDDEEVIEFSEKHLRMQWDELKEMFAERRTKIENGEECFQSDFLIDAQAWFDAGCPPPVSEDDDRFQLVRKACELEFMSSAVATTAMQRAIVEERAVPVSLIGQDAANSFSEMVLSNESEQAEEDFYDGGVVNEEEKEFEVCEESRKEYWDNLEKTFAERRLRIDRDGNDEDSDTEDWNDSVESYLAEGRPPVVTVNGKRKADKFLDVRDHYEVEAKEYAIIGAARKRAKLEGASQDECAQRVRDVRCNWVWVKRERQRAAKKKQEEAAEQASSALRTAQLELFDFMAGVSHFRIEDKEGGDEESVDDNRTPEEIETETMALEIANEWLDERLPPLPPSLHPFPFMLTSTR